MTLRAGVGRSLNKQAAIAGREAARAALGRLGAVPPRAALLFATVGYEQKALVDAAGEVLGDLPLLGCSAEGIITREGSYEGSHGVAIVVLGGQNLQARVHAVEGLSTGPEAKGRALGEAVAAGGGADLLLLFPDGLSADCSALLAALDAALPGVPVVGGTAGDAMRMARTYQYAGRQVLSDGAVALALRGVQAHVAISHGCDPIGIECTITRAEGSRVYEIDGRPAWELYAEYIEQGEEAPEPVEITHLCLGERLSPEEASGYGAYLIRTPLGRDEETGALIFPGGLKSGTRVQMVRRNPDRIAASAVEIARRIREGEDRPPALVLQFDCAGRGRVIFGERVNDTLIRPMHETVGPEPAWFGCHTFGEIAPLAGRTRFHNYTAVLCALCERERP
ncbi:MAG: hypothetical protein D6729_01705 [Deltaproteobacteria bacterium]|nr:MAG: hypothetical protein D6729_01705 [Deltaproteobacteria bacterium]